MSAPALAPSVKRLSVADSRPCLNVTRVLGPDLPDEHPARQAWLTCFEALLNNADPLSSRGFKAARAASLLVLARKLETRLLEALDHPDLPLPSAAAISQCMRLEQEAAEILESLGEEPPHDTDGPMNTLPDKPVCLKVPTPASSVLFRQKVSDSAGQPDNPPALSHPPITHERSRPSVPCCLEEPPDPEQTTPEYRLRVARAEREAGLLLPKTRPSANRLIREASRRVLLDDLPSHVHRFPAVRPPS